MSSNLARSTNLLNDLAGTKGGFTGSDEPTKPYSWLEQARFWSKVDIPEAPRDTGLCWPWRASLAKGYGQLKLKDRGVLRAHRVAYELAHGPVPRGLEVLHSCDNPTCVNPRHLRAATHAENMGESRDRGRVWYGGPRRKEAP